MRRRRPRVGESPKQRTSRVELATNDGLTVSTKIRARPSIAIMDKRMHRQFLNMRRETCALQTPLACGPFQRPLASASERGLAIRSTFALSIWMKTWWDTFGNPETVWRMLLGEDMSRQVNTKMQHQILSECPLVGRHHLDTNQSLMYGLHA